MVFQFPNRNSVRLNEMRASIGAAADVVSIPQSEFCAFEPAKYQYPVPVVLPVSIPQSEFCAFEPRWGHVISGGVATFQFPNRNSVRLNAAISWRNRFKSAAFQFPNRNSVRLNERGGIPTPWMGFCFNSPIGILCV